MSSEIQMVSVIIPTYNSAKYLPEALESIFNQNYENIEVIVIDDGSTDNTADILLPYQDRIIYHYKKNGGPASARNYGLSIANGEIIGFLDADDIWPLDKLMRQLSHMEEDTEIEIVVGREYVEYLSDARELLYNEDLVMEAQICQSLPVSLIRRSAFDKIGKLDEDLIYFEDWDWHLRARERGLKILVYNEVTNIHRRHSSNMTHNIAKMNKYAFYMFRKALQRRRENPEIKTKLPSISEIEIRRDYDK